MKRLLTIQDLSCVGKCSLSVALPVISAAGVEAVALPTALLSTHTAFPAPYVQSLEEALEPIARHWSENHVRFDCICTGYLASKEQINTVLNIAERFKTGTALLIADPVMADNGRLYSRFDSSYVDAMKGYVSHADIILPNLTEASLLADHEYIEHMPLETAVRILEKLTENGKTAIITGFNFDAETTGVIGLNGSTGGFFEYRTALLPNKYHGTGDIFASTFSAAIALGASAPDASRIACEFTSECIKKTPSDLADKRFGVYFEEALPLLFELTKDYRD